MHRIILVFVRIMEVVNNSSPAGRLVPILLILAVSPDPP
jgi:hypothetical protein